MSTTEVLDPVSTTTQVASDAPAVQTWRFPQTVGNASNRWGVILAGGDDVHLRELTRVAPGHDRPKQFCTLLGSHTLLEETRKRAERSIPPKQILFPVTRAHERYYLRYLASRAAQRIVQPCNKGTAPAILCALMRVARMDPEAIVAIFPCDHVYSPESAFTIALESAFTLVEQRSRAVVLLGAQPKSPGVDHGWIEVGEPVHRQAGLYRVKGFHENPPLAVAQDLFRAGSLWNTFVMVGRARSFLGMAQDAVPALLQVFESESARRGPDGEIRIADSVYDRIAPTDFSRQILSAATDRLLALRLSGIEWSDLDDPHQVLATLAGGQRNLPGWAMRWSTSAA
jgi:mannose-1-phosphate guanylyltransferase